MAASLFGGCSKNDSGSSNYFKHNGVKANLDRADFSILNGSYNFYFTSAENSLLFGVKETDLGRSYTYPQEDYISAFVLNMSGNRYFENGITSGTISTKVIDKAENNYQIKISMTLKNNETLELNYSGKVRDISY